MSKQRAYIPLVSSVMNYTWASFGKDNNPTIAFVAPSNGIGGEEGQRLIRQKIGSLVEKELRVKVPQYKDGSLLVESEVIGRKTSNRLGTTISPAVSNESGASQIIDCILNGWNIVPWMGGDNFENKIPIIVKHFEAHPEQKNPNIKMFGVSNSTYATILASRGICSFISTPFISVFDRAKSDPEHFSAPAQELEKLLKGQETEPYSRSIIYNPDNKLSDVRQTFHYPMNFGNITWEIERAQRVKKNLQDPSNNKSEEELVKEESLTSLQTPEGQTWSISIEGFLQKPSSQLMVRYGNCLHEFLQQHQDHLPAFIEIGNIATRLDGKNGYQNLLHDEATGQIVISEDIESDYNVNKVYADRQKLAQDVKELFDEKTKLESSINDVSFNSLPPRQQRLMERQLQLLSFTPNEIFQKLNHDIALDEQGLNKEDIANILRSQNLVQLEIMRDLMLVATEYKIPLIQNTRNGHCANMSIVNGGNNEIRLEGNKVAMIMQHMQGHISPISCESLAASATLTAILTKEMQQDFIAATQQNYVMGKVTYYRCGGKDEIPVITTQGQADFHNPDKPMTAETIGGIGSITKQFTAATLLKLWDEEITRGEAENFPNGIDTTLSHFMLGLRIEFPKCEKIFDQFGDENCAKVTLRNLLNHTHGLGARDGEKIMNHMQDVVDRPLELDEVIGFTVKPTENEYGEHNYSNLGYDLAAMIIEVITKQKFDDVVKAKVLDPNGLSNTHPQKDHLKLYAKPETEISRGFVFNDYNTEVETNFNTRSNTRAAGGFKSTVEDLAKFAASYMGAEMFENEEVKKTIRENSKGAKLDKDKKGTRPSMKGDEMYHLAMTTNRNGTIGHPGVDGDFLANLRFNPETKDITVSLSVIENLSSHICNKVLEKKDPQTLQTIRKFWQDKLSPELIKNNKPEVGSELWHKITEEVLAKETDAEVPDAIKKYSSLRRQVLSIPRKDLIEEKESIVESLIKSESEQKKSFAQRIRNNETQGKSHGAVV